MAEPNKVSAIVLAAGSSERFGDENKLLSDLNGTPLVRRTVESVCRVPFLETIVVCGWQAQQVRDALQGLPIMTVDNNDFSNGLGTSIGVGTRATEGSGEGVFLILADMPFLRSETLETMCRALTSQSKIVVSRSPAMTGSPVLFGSDYLHHLRALQGLEGAKTVWGQVPQEVVFVEIDPREHLDVDTPADFQGTT